jgi:hypothetical protein
MSVPEAIEVCGMFYFSMDTFGARVGAFRRRSSRAIDRYVRPPSTRFVKLESHKIGRDLHGGLNGKNFDFVALDSELGFAASRPSFAQLIFQ